MLGATGAAAQISLTPPGLQQPPAARSRKAKAQARPPAPAAKNRRHCRRPPPSPARPRSRLPRARAEQHDPAGTALPRADLQRSERRSGLRRLSARTVQDRVRSCDRARASRRCQGDDHAGRALRERAGHQARLRQGGRLVQARRRRRRPRGDVRAGHDAARRPRRPDRPPGGGQAARLRGQARRAQGRLQSGAALSRRPDPAAGPQALPPSCCGWPPTPATRKRNTRWRPSTRKAPASRRTWKRRRGCCRRRRSPTMSMPRSNTPSRCSTAPARRRTSPPRWRCCERRPGRTARSRRTGWRMC